MLKPSKKLRNFVISLQIEVTRLWPSDGPTLQRLQKHSVSSLSYDTLAQNEKSLDCDNGTSMHRCLIHNVITGKELSFNLE